MAAHHTSPDGIIVRLDDLPTLPPTLDIETAAAVLGIGRTLAYQLAKQDRFPCRVLRIGRRYLVPTIGLISLLGAATTAQDVAG